MKRRPLLLVIGALTLALASCTSSVPGADSSSVSSSPAPAQSTTSEAPTGCDPAPLTGLTAHGAKPQAVLGVKVENSPRARPQSGLEDADIVFVQLVEGGETRFLALYDSVLPESVGPVRSIRPTDAALLGQWDAGVALFFSGGIQDFVNKVNAAGVQVLEEGAKGFYRASTRVAPHNLYVSLAEGTGVVSQPEQCSEAFVHYLTEGETKDGGVPASSVTVAYPSVTSGWAWNAQASAWERSDDGVETTSLTSGEVVTATNVVVVTAQTRNLSYTDVAGAAVPETILEGTGKLDYFMTGQHFTGTWQKAGVNDPFVFTDDQGDAVALEPGNTWVELLPASGSLTVK